MKHFHFLICLTLLFLIGSISGNIYTQETNYWFHNYDSGSFLTHDIRKNEDDMIYLYG